MTGLHHAVASHSVWPSRNSMHSLALHHRRESFLAFLSIPPLLGSFTFLSQSFGIGVCVAAVAFALTVATAACPTVERKMPSECPSSLQTERRGLPCWRRRKLSIRNPFARPGGVPTGAICDSSSKTNIVTTQSTAAAWVLNQCQPFKSLQKHSPSV
jgi:hypothetical protein